MEGQAAEIADRAEHAAVPGRADRLGGVLDDHEAVPARDVHDGVHIAGYAGIMHDDDRAGFVRDGFFDPVLVDVHRIRADIRKDERRAAKHECVGGGAEGIGRQDDLVARFDVAQKGGHLQCGRAGCRQVCSRDLQLLLQKLLAFFRKRPVAADFFVQRGFAHIFRFGSNKWRYIKINH